MRKVILHWKVREGKGLQMYTCQRSLGEASHARSLNLPKERDNTDIKIQFN